MYVVDDASSGCSVPMECVDTALGSSPSGLCAIPSASSGFPCSQTAIMVLLVLEVRIREEVIVATNTSLAAAL